MSAICERFVDSFRRTAARISDSHICAYGGEGIKITTEIIGEISGYLLSRNTVHIETGVSEKASMVYIS